ncbi:MAG: hypothetical protein ABI664_10365 [bacterium]
MPDTQESDANTSGRSGEGRLAAWLIGLAALSAAIVIISTVGDVLGVSGDSTQYLSAADNLAAGNGLRALWWSGRSETLTHFPPLYPVFLAQLMRWSGKVPEAAYFLNALLAPVNVLLLALLAARTTRGLGRDFSLPAAAVAAVCGSVANHLLLVHAMVWSEPLYICLSLLSLIALLNVLEHPRALGWYAVLVCTAATALLTRFAGIALIGAIGLAIVLLQRTSLRQRLGIATIVGVTSILPMMLLLTNGASGGGATANREIVVHLIQRRDIAYGLTTILSWAAPLIPHPRVYAVLIGLYVIALALLFAARSPRGHRPLATATDITVSGAPLRLTTALAIVVVTYLAFLVVSISVADRSTMLDKRILTPALVVTLVCAVSLGMRQFALSRTFPATHRIFTRSALAMVLMVYLVAQSFGLAGWFTRVRANGIGFAQIERYSPALVERIRLLPPSAVLYSNSPYVVHFLTGRTVVGLPFRRSPTSLKTNATLPDDLRAMRKVANESDVYLIDVGQRQSYLVADSTIVQYVHMDSSQVLPGGRIQFLQGSLNPALSLPPEM